MRRLLPVAFFSNLVSTLVLQPLITPAPQLAIRDDAPNICGYYSLNSLIETISCSIGTPCMVETSLTPAVAFCSRTDNVPVTTIYPYGEWPNNQGCGSGAACCPLLKPDTGEYLFNQGSTVLLGCNTVSFTYNAFVSKPTAGQAAATTSPSFALPTTSPEFDNTAASVTPLPSQTDSSSSSSSGSSSSFSTSTTIIIIVVGAVVALIGGLVFLWFLYMAWKVHHNARYRQRHQYVPIHPFHNSPTSFQTNGTPPVKKSGLSNWAKAFTVISSIFTIAGVAVSIYFGIKQSSK